MRTEISVDSDDDDAFFDSEDDDDDQDEPKVALYNICMSKEIREVCQECPVVKPTFLCGNDNRTYSSPCRLEYHNCIHHTSVHIACKGFCPCRAADLRLYSKKMQMQRKKTFMGKMGHNHDITLTPRDFNYDNHHYQYLKYTKRGKLLEQWLLTKQEPIGEINEIVELDEAKIGKRKYNTGRIRRQWVF
ncbi:testican-like protein, partial [Lasius niger]